MGSYLRCQTICNSCKILRIHPYRVYSYNHIRLRRPFQHCNSSSYRLPRFIRLGKSTIRGLQTSRVSTWTWISPKANSPIQISQVGKLSKKSSPRPSGCVTNLTIKPLKMSKFGLRRLICRSLQMAFVGTGIGMNWSRTSRIERSIEDSEFNCLMVWKTWRFT